MRIATLSATLILVSTMASAVPKPTSAPTLPRDLIDAHAKVEKLASGMKFTEGPVWLNDSFGKGRLIFSDIDGNQLKSWIPGEGLNTFRQDSHQANGNTVDVQGRLVTCEHGARRVTRTEKDGTITVLADSFQNRKLNSPNDVVVKSDGTIFFTDPPYGLLKRKKEQEHNYVFRLDPSAHEPTAIVSDFDMPNGLCFSPDEKKLYIADSGAPHHIRVFDLQRQDDAWQLANAKIFCTIDKGVPDGIRCDERGNVWSSAGDGVHVFSPTGELLGKIFIPETPANLSFGDDDRKTLFMTARNSLYSIRVNVAGASKR
jgi:gluconolactonase